MHGFSSFHPGGDCFGGRVHRGTGQTIPLFASIILVRDEWRGRDVFFERGTFGLSSIGEKLALSFPFFLLSPQSKSLFQRV